MKKDIIFFSQDGSGLTSTSANHIANMAKEMVREVESSLAGLTFYSTSVSLIGSDNINTLKQGNSKDDLEQVQHKLMKIAKANSLIAWLHEAIKAKERLLSEVERMTVKEYMDLKGIDPIILSEPLHVLTEDEYYASQTIDQRNRYYELEALAAVLGKAIHPNGALADARVSLNEKIRNPKDVNGEGRDALIYSYTATVQPEEVDGVYFKLQKRFREVQADVNAMKFECQKAVKTSQIESQIANAEATAKRNAQIIQVTADLNAYIKQRTREIADWKIMIPQSLKGIYDEVSHLGKS
ncbi:hypothetical protein [uncultured Duncaniella sp.]|uniref:hypothetical protein n=1 Tax=uncultured Duncaniella sp. TaxID=2768039 RepID=UPI003220695E